VGVPFGFDVFGGVGLRSGHIGFVSLLELSVY